MTRGPLTILVVVASVPAALFRRRGRDERFGEASQTEPSADSAPDPVDATEPHGNTEEVVGRSDALAEVRPDPHPLRPSEMWHPGIVIDGDVEVGPEVRVAPADLVDPPEPPGRRRLPRLTAVEGDVGHTGPREAPEQVHRAAPLIGLTLPGVQRGFAAAAAESLTDGDSDGVVETPGAEGPDLSEGHSRRLRPPVDIFDLDLRDGMAEPPVASGRAEASVAGAGLISGPVARRPRQEQLRRRGSLFGSGVVAIGRAEGDSILSFPSDLRVGDDGTVAVDGGVLRVGDGFDGEASLHADHVEVISRGGGWTWVVRDVGARRPVRILLDSVRVEVTAGTAALVSHRSGGGGAVAVIAGTVIVGEGTDLSHVEAGCTAEITAVGVLGVVRSAPETIAAEPTVARNQRLDLEIATSLGR